MSPNSDFCKKLYNHVLHEVSTTLQQEYSGEMASGSGDSGVDFGSGMFSSVMPVDDLLSADVMVTDEIGHCNTHNISDIMSCLQDVIINKHSELEAFCGCLPPHTSHKTSYVIAYHFPQILLAFLGLIMNISGIYMKRKRRGKHFPSEYLLISLCISDLIFCLFVFIMMVMVMIQEKTDLLRDSHLDMVIIPILQFTVLASIIHVLAIAFERVFAFSLPLRHLVFACKRNIKKIVITIWVATILVNTGLLGYQFQHRGMSSDTECDHELMASRVVGIFMYTSALLLIVMYSILTYQLEKQTKFTKNMHKSQREANCMQSTKQREKMETAAFFMAVFISVAFLVCTIPFATVSILGISNPSSQLESASECLLICNSILNPLIYLWRGFWCNTRRKDSSYNTRIIKKVSNTVWYGNWTVAELSSINSNDSNSRNESVTDLTHFTQVVAVIERNQITNFTI